MIIIFMKGGKDNFLLFDNTYEDRKMSQSSLNRENYKDESLLTTLEEGEDIISPDKSITQQTKAALQSHPINLYDVLDIEGNEKQTSGSTQEESAMDQQLEQKISISEEKIQEEKINEEKILEEKTPEEKISEEKSSIEQLDSEYKPKSEKSVTKEKKRKRIINKNKTDLNKNNFSNIVRFATKMLVDLSGEDDSVLAKFGVQLKQFRSFIENIVTSQGKDRSCSRVNLSNYFTSLSKEKEKMKRIFLYKFEKLLRTNYLVQALRKGRMDKDKQFNYIQTKNREVLYFRDYLNSSKN